MKKMIIILACVLFILVVLSLILSKKTIVKPPNSSPNSNKPQEVIAPFTRDEEQKRLAQIRRDPSKVLSSSQKDRLSSFQKKLPYQSSAFDINYSPALDRYIITKKSLQTYVLITSFLKDNDVLDIYSADTGAFIVTDDLFDQAVLKIQSTIREGEEK